MVGTLQPLSSYFSICDEKGLPTDYFIRWCQQRQIDIGDGITAAQAQVLIDAAILSALTTHKIQAGTGITLSPTDGELIHDPTISADIQALLNTISTTRGSILYRGSSSWAALAPGTTGNVLSTNGAGADPSWIAAGGGGGIYTDKQSLNGLNTITFTVPAGYTTLRLIISGATLAVALQDNPLVRVNGLSTSIYSVQRHYDFSTTNTADQVLSSTSWNASLCGLPGTTAPANTSGYIVIELFDYTNTTFRKTGTFKGRQPFSTSTTASGQMMGALEVDLTAAITSITVSTGSGSNFKNGSSAELVLFP